MANHSVQQQYQVSGNSGGASNASQHHCKECGLVLNSAESLEVHLQYHKENLLNKWATQASAAAPASAPDETNNNSAQGGTKLPPIKREFSMGGTAVTAAPADSSDSMLKKSPEYVSANRATPESGQPPFGHPPTPQSYHSSSSPYQTPDNSTFSPGFAYGGAHVKQERSTTPQHYPNYANFQAQQQQEQFFVEGGMPASYPNQDFPVPKMSSFVRYHPYQQQYELAQQRNAQVTSSSPAYPPQPTPSPSPKQCDKCGYVCESATQLIEHLNVAHPPTPHIGFQQHQQFMFNHQQQHQSGQQQDVPTKTEEDAQSEILDLDSHKVVHPVYPEDEKVPGQPRHNGDLINGQQNHHNPHSVSAMLGNAWPPSAQQSQKMFVPPERTFLNEQQEPVGKLFPSEFLSNGVTTSEPSPQQQFRPFEAHISASAAAQATPIITSTQATQGPPQDRGKGTNWKSNEARRPKTYNCTACNKWFTSSGHLKRHYNTTLHKNAVKSSGQPDPASLPISAHHHPARDPPTNRDEMQSMSRQTSGSGGSTGSPGDTGVQDDIIGAAYDRPSLGTTTHHLQQPPSGPYDRQTSAGLPSGGGGVGVGGLHNLHPASPNAEAGSSFLLHHQRSLLNSSVAGHHLMAQPPQPPPVPGQPVTNNSLSSVGYLTSTEAAGVGVGPPPQVSSLNTMYPNEFAPHVTLQATDTITTNSLNIIGEYQALQAAAAAAASAGQHESVINIHQHQHEQPLLQHQQQQQSLPSFANFAASSRNLLLGYYANSSVGGPGPVTAPYTIYTYQDEDLIAAEEADEDQQMLIEDADPDYDSKYTILTPVELNVDTNSLPDSEFNDDPLSTSPLGDNNNFPTEMEPKFIIKDVKIIQRPTSPEKAKVKRDFEEGAGSPSITSTTIKKPRYTAVNPLIAEAIAKNAVHKCYDCDKLFNKACYLTQHNKTFHSGDKPFKCGRCGKRFSGDEQYQEHLTKHAGDKPHKCDLCPKQFNHKTDLRRHMCLHTGQKPYICTTCNKGFIRKDHMMKHCEIHTRKPPGKNKKIIIIDESSTTTTSSCS